MQFVISAQGAAGVPAVTVSGPGGDSITTNPVGHQMQGRFLVLNSATDRTTYIAIAQPQAGTWTVTAAAGSQPITLLRSAQSLPDPSIQASLHDVGGGKMRLDYSIRHIDGQQVSFVEKGQDTGHALGAAQTDNGSITFTPGDGIAGERKIIAIVNQSGLPRTTIEVAHYRAAGRTLPDRPTGLRADRSGTNVNITWKAAQRSTRYAVTADLDDGRRLLFVVEPNDQRVALAGVFPDSSGTITVAGLLGDNTPGPRAVLHLGTVQTGGTPAWVAVAGAAAVGVAGLGAVTLAIFTWRRRRSSRSA